MEKVSIRPAEALSEDMVYCFICHKELDREMLVLVMNPNDEMICMCGDHLGERDFPVSRGIKETLNYEVSCH